MLPPARASGAPAFRRSTAGSLWRINASAQLQPRFLGNLTLAGRLFPASRRLGAMGCHPILPAPVQRAPRRPVIDTGRAVSGAAWERGYEPRPQAPHPPRQLAVTGDVPSWAGSVHVTETVTMSIGW